MKAAFSKLSPKYALSVACERREKFGLYNEELFNGIDKTYFRNVFSAYIALHEYEVARHTVNFAFQVCKEHGQTGDDLKRFFQRKTASHIQRYGTEGINEGILAVSNDLEKSQNLDKNCSEEKPGTVIKQSNNPIMKVCQYLNNLATSASNKIGRLFS